MIPFQPQTELFHWMWVAENGNIFLQTSSSPALFPTLHQLFQTPEQGVRGCAAAPFQILIPRISPSFRWAKKRPGEWKKKKRLWQTLISEKQAGKKKRRQRKKKPITHAGKPTAGKCCTWVACSESDNPPVSSLCVSLNFYLLLWGKRQLPYR